MNFGVRMKQTEFLTSGNGRFKVGPLIQTIAGTDSGGMNFASLQPLIGSHSGNLIEKGKNLHPGIQLSQRQTPVRKADTILHSQSQQRWSPMPPWIPSSQG